jgi:hypothetical protein
MIELFLGILLFLLIIISSVIEFFDNWWTRLQDKRAHRKGLRIDSRFIAEAEKRLLLARMKDESLKQGGLK